MSRDPLDILRSDDRVDQAKLDGPESPRAQDLLKRILDTPRRPDEKPQTRRKIALAIAAVIVLLGGGAAAWALTRPSSVTEPTGVACYEELSLDAAIVVVPPAESPAVSDCEDLWIDGPFTSPDTTTTSPPELVGCVLPSGALAVFPTPLSSAQACERLELAPFMPQTPNVPEAVVQLGSRLRERYLNDCVSPIDAASEVEQLLRELGLAEWSVTVEDARQNRPCASASLDAESMTVFVVPVPRGP